MTNESTKLRAKFFELFPSPNLFNPVETRSRTEKKFQDKMWIESITVKGFRSFRDEEKITFDRHHTAIVGR